MVFQVACNIIFKLVIGFPELILNISENWRVLTLCAYGRARLASELTYSIPDAKVLMEVIKVRY
jgi:hypothetical protein